MHSLEVVVAAGNTHRGASKSWHDHPPPLTYHNCLVSVLFRSSANNPTASNEDTQHSFTKRTKRDQLKRVFSWRHYAIIVVAVVEEIARGTAQMITLFLVLSDMTKARKASPLSLPGDFKRKEFKGKI